MKRRAIIVLLAAVMTVGVFAGCKGSNESDSAKTEETADGGESKDDILGDGVFTVGFDAEYPPFGYMDDTGEYVGFDLDWQEPFARRRGGNLKLNR